MSVDASARLATFACAPEALVRAGATQRTLNLVGAGIPVEIAADLVSRQAKGNVAEFDQAASLSHRAGALGRDAVAYPNPVANDPLDDVFVVTSNRRGRRKKRGVQMKVVRHLSKKHLRKYRHIVTSAPLPERIPAGTVVEDRLRDSEHEARKLVAEDVRGVAALALQKQVTGQAAVDWGDLFWAAFKAGGAEAVVSAVTSLGFDAVKSWWMDTKIDWLRASRDAIVQAIRAGARAFLQTLLLAKEYLSQAGRKYSAAALHAVGAAAVFLGAVAEVIVEVVADGIEWFRGRISFEQLLRRIPVHLLTAGGSALGVVLAAALTEGAPWWVQMAGLVLLGAVGAQAGRLLAEQIVPDAAGAHGIA